MKSETGFTDPRNITTRKDQYLVRLGPVISAIEEQILKDVTVKGLNLNERAAKMFARFGPKDGQFLETDYSRFDQTIRQELLDIEYQLYTSFYDDPEFAVLLKQQQRTFGSLAFGIPYKRLGGRCSGDANTSIGNCLINYFVAWVAHQRLGHKFEGFV
jgi:hypothetical protein